MPFEYYCTNCGKKLSQDTVLFDMQYVFTKEQTRKFSILKFRLRLAELTALYEKATPTEENFREIQIPFKKLLGYISNQDNLNDPQIACLTMNDINSYIGESNMNIAPETQHYQSKAPFGMSEEQHGQAEDLFADNNTPIDPFATLMGTGQEQIRKKRKKELEDIPVADENLTPAIQALLKKDTANKDMSKTKHALIADFKYLKLVCDANGTCKINLRLITEKDNNNADIITGYQIYPSLFIDETAEPRVCGKCGYPVFRHAGTARHQNIAFFGTQRSGKTSLLVAITHYIMNGMQIALGEDNVWKNAERISAVKTVQLLNNKPKMTSGEDEKKYFRNDMLFRDLERYPQGIAPPKTDALSGKNAYSATFRIQDTLGRYHLLTLTDLPGELIDDDTGVVNRTKVADEFPTALACDAYVICFDTCKEEQGQKPIQATLLASDTIQNMQATECHKTGHVPVIIVYTKCAALESVDVLEDPRTGTTRVPEKQAHMFCGECERISTTPAYAFISDQFENYQHLKDAYKTRLRCAAFGYKAPTYSDLSKDPNIPVQKPTPKYVEHLVRWLLSISGCIPVEGSYSAMIHGPAWTEAENYISRVQYRGEKPLSSDSLREALARVILFENPTNVDVDYVQSHGDRAALIRARFRSIFGRRQ